MVLIGTQGSDATWQVFQPNQLSQPATLVKTFSLSLQGFSYALLRTYMCPNQMSPESGDQRHDRRDSPDLSEPKDLPYNILSIC